MQQSVGAISSECPRGIKSELADTCTFFGRNEGNFLPSRQVYQGQAPQAVHREEPAIGGQAGVEIGVGSLPVGERRTQHPQLPAWNNPQ